MKKLCPMGNWLLQTKKGLGFATCFEPFPFRTIFVSGTQEPVSDGGISGFKCLVSWCHILFPLSPGPLKPSSDPVVHKV